MRISLFTRTTHSWYGTNNSIITNFVEMSFEWATTSMKLLWFYGRRKISALEPQCSNLPCQLFTRYMTHDENWSMLCGAVCSNAWCSLVVEMCFIRCIAFNVNVINWTVIISWGCLALNTFCSLVFCLFCCCCCWYWMEGERACRITRLQQS